MTSACDDNTQFFMILVGVAVTSACDDNTQLVFMILVGVAVTSACDDNTQFFYDFSCGSGCDQCL